MPSESLSASSEDFFRIAEDLVMLTKDQVLIMMEAIKKSGSPPEQIALQKGFLDATQIDIIETLLHPTETVPGYEIIDVLGQGGMGVVYRARQVNLNRIVALKTILLSRMADKSTASRFALEAQTIGKLRHPNIIAAYDFGQYEGRLFLSMELVEGEDVEALLQDRRRLDEASAWGLARQAAAGLAHADHLGVVHRDIKPANLLLVKPPEGFSLPQGLQMVKVADFGLAFLADDQQAHTRLTSDNSAVGSPHYMAPEQLTDMDVDFRADIYALGATVYHMLAGRPPFGGLNLSQIIAQKLSGEFKPLRERCPELSEPSCQLVSHMLAREPANRHENYDSLLKDIDRLIHSLDSPASSGATVTTGPEMHQRASDISTRDTQSLPSENFATDKSPRRSPQAVQRQQRRMWGLGVAILACSLGGIAWLMPKKQVSPPVVQRVEMVHTGWSNPLFVGTKTIGWRNQFGNWVAGRDNEDGFVLEGTNGVIERPLFKPGEDGKSVPIEFYRLDLSVNPHEASAVELHFSLIQVPGFDGPRYVVRISPEGVCLGMRASDQDPFVPQGTSTPLRGKYQSRHAVHVDRQPSAWFVTVDGQDLPGLPSLTPELAGVKVDESRKWVTLPLLPGFRLKVEDGPAWFSDVFIEELQPPAK